MRAAAEQVGDVSFQELDVDWTLQLLVSPDHLLAQLRVQLRGPDKDCPPDRIIAFIRTCGVKLSATEEQQLGEIAERARHGTAAPVQIARRPGAPPRHPQHPLAHLAGQQTRRRSAQRCRLRHAPGPQFRLGRGRAIPVRAAGDHGGGRSRHLRPGAALSARGGRRRRSPADPGRRGRVRRRRAHRGRHVRWLRAVETRRVVGDPRARGQRQRRLQERQHRLQRRSRDPGRRVARLPDQGDRLGQDRRHGRTGVDHRRRLRSPCAAAWPAGTRRA